jgi:hypothetical protein
MRTVSILAASSAHQQQHAYALADGLARHGYKAQISARANELTSDIVACWGWRNGQQFSGGNRRVLVMERGYLGDRFSWSSLGWDGLNGRARLPQVADDASRFNKHFAHLFESEARPGREHVLLIGQVPRDAALAGRDLSRWYLDTAKEAAALYGLPTVFRPHPRAPANSYPVNLYSVKGDLAAQIRSAAAVITYNSNTGVESVMAGVPTLSFDEGSMAWAVTGHELGKHYDGDRLQWAQQMAWKQWMIEEIEDGSALERVFEVM